jgi:hypothetical protein
MSLSIFQSIPQSLDLVIGRTAEQTLLGGFSAVPQCIFQRLLKAFILGQLSGSGATTTHRLPGPMEYTPGFLR